MAIIKNQKVVFAEFDLTASLRQINLAITREAPDNTTFNTSTRVSEGGIFSVSLDWAGLFASDGVSAIDDILDANLGVPDKLISVALEDGTVNSRAVSLLALQTEYAPIDAGVGDLHVIAFKAVGSGGILVVNGNVEKPLGDTTSTTASTGSQLGILAAGQKLYSSMHVISASGTSPTLDVLVESDVVGFAGANTRITHTRATGATTEQKSISGPIATDDYWRISWTIGGTDAPTFSWFQVIGIV